MWRQVWTLSSKTFPHKNVLKERWVTEVCVCVPVSARVISDWRREGMLCHTGESLCPRLLQIGWKMIKISMMPGPISLFLMEPGGTNYSAAGLGKKIPPLWNITAQLSAFMAAQNFSWHQLFSFGKDKILESTALFCCCNFLKKFSLLPERIASHEYACVCRLWASQKSRVPFPGILPAGCPRGAAHYQFSLPVDLSTNWWPAC